MEVSSDQALLAAKQSDHQSPRDTVHKQTAETHKEHRTFHPKQRISRNMKFQSVVGAVFNDHDHVGFVPMFEPRQFQPPEPQITHSVSFSTIPVSHSNLYKKGTIEKQRDLTLKVENLCQLLNLVHLPFRSA